MELLKNEREFFLHEKMKISMYRSDFDELGSILEIAIKPIENSNLNILSTNFFAMSFYDHNKVQLPHNELVLLMDQENHFFDNILIFSNLNNQIIRLKLLNKEIHYVKVFVTTISLNLKKARQESDNITSNNFIDVYKMKQIDNNSNSDPEQKNNNTSSISTDYSHKNDHINLILEELNQVNTCLMNEKEKIEKSKTVLKNKEEQINSMVISFKKEILIHSDKFFNESSTKFTNKLNDVQKKLQIIESNVVNKYKIIKEKLNEKNSFSDLKNKNIYSSKNSREKLANMEIKIKFLEDSANNLKARLIDKDDIIKASVESEDKLNKMIKKGKDEIYNLQNKLKLYEEKDKTENSSATVTNHNPSQNKENMKSSLTVSVPNNKINLLKKTVKNKFEFTKLLVNHYTEHLIMQLIIVNNQENLPANFISIFEKDFSLCLNLILHMCINPINLFNKFPFSFIFVAIKIFQMISKNSLDSNLLKEKIAEIINNFPEFKKQLLSMGKDIEIINNSANNSKTTPLVNLIIDEKDQININQILLNKLKSFSVYFSKHEKKYSEKNNYAFYKIVTISILIQNIFLTTDQEELLSIFKNILMIKIYTKDFISINYLIYSLNYFIIFSRFLNPQVTTSEKHVNELLQIFIDSVLFLYSLDMRYNIFEINGNIVEYLTQKTTIINFLDGEINKLNSKAILFASILCGYSKKEIKFSIDQTKLNDEILLLNLKKII